MHYRTLSLRGLIKNAFGGVRSGVGNSIASSQEKLIKAVGVTIKLKISFFKILTLILCIIIYQRNSLTSLLPKLVLSILYTILDS